MDLTTTYMGFRLPHPLVVGAGPLTDDLDTVRALEDAGAAAIVLRPMYEEEINDEQMDAMIYEESHSDSFAEAQSFSHEPEQPLGPTEYLEHLYRVKQAVSVPVIAALNAVTPDGWIAYAQVLEQAGANAIELQVFHAAGDMSIDATTIEDRAVATARSVKTRLRIPVAVKLSMMHTAFAHFASLIDGTGVDGLVLFARTHHADIDVEALEVVRTLPLSEPRDLSLRLRGTAALSGRVKCSLAVSGGVYSALDVIKATMAGAHVTQMVSALIAHGPAHLRAVRADLAEWMREHEWASLNEMRGNMSFERIPDPAAYERANVRMTHT